MTVNLLAFGMGRGQRDRLIQENVIKVVHTIVNLAIVCNGGCIR